MYCATSKGERIMDKKPDKTFAATKQAEKKAQILKELSGKAPVDKRVITNKTESRCYTCSLATPILCEWIRNGSREGLEYVTKTVYPNPGNKIELTVITGCEKYAPGPLPPVAWERLDAGLLAGVAGR